MGVRKKRSRGHRASGEARLARLAQAGLVKKRDFKRSGGKLTRSSSDTLRKIDRAIGKYARSPDFALYKPKSVSERKKLAHVLPQELRGLKLAAVPLRVERRVKANRVVKNKLRRVSFARDGTVRIDTDGPSFLYPKLTRDELLDTAKAARRIAKLKGKRRSLRVLTGMGTLNQMRPIESRDQVADAVERSLGAMLVYSRDPRSGEDPLKAIRGVDFTEGLMVEIRRKNRATGQTTERRKKSRKKGSRGKSKKNRSNRR